MPNIKPKTHRAAFTMRVEPEFLEMLDEVRAYRRPVLNRSDAVRELVLEAARKIPKAKKRTPGQDLNWPGWKKIGE